MPDAETPLEPSSPPDVGDPSQPSPVVTPQAAAAPSPLDALRAAYKRHGYAWFDSAPYDLNLFGVRCATGTNLFDDLVGCAWFDDHGWHLEVWPATTDPGRYYLQQPMVEGGTAILVEGQHRGCWTLGEHFGYPALVQWGGEVPVYRDATLDTAHDLDPTTITTGWYGINLHKAAAVTEAVDNWSAGCQVLARHDHFDRLMRLARLQQQHNPGWATYTYTLLTLDADPSLALLQGLL